MSPQPSNRTALLEGALRCLARMPVDQVSARAVAAESGANLASIGYHFGSKDALVTAAVVAGLDRWLDEIAARASVVRAGADPADRFRRAVDAADASRGEHEGLARAYVVALGRAQHDPVVAERLIDGFRRTRPAVASVLGLGADDIGVDAGALMHAMFTGLLVQSLLDEDLALSGDRIADALQRIADALAGQGN
ncbi:TetR/AcrR family transcriptional regulator [Nocardia sp. NPDC055029]